MRWCTLNKAKEELEKIRSSEKYNNESQYINDIEDFLKSEEERYRSYISNS